MANNKNIGDYTWDLLKKAATQQTGTPRTVTANIPDWAKVLGQNAYNTVETVKDFGQNVYDATKVVRDARENTKNRLNSAVTSFTENLKTPDNMPDWVKDLDSDIRNAASDTKDFYKQMDSKLSYLPEPVRQRVMYPFGYTNALVSGIIAQGITHPWMNQQPQAGAANASPMTYTEAANSGVAPASAVSNNPEAEQIAVSPLRYSAPSSAETEKVAPPAAVNSSGNQNPSWWDNTVNTVSSWFGGNNQPTTQVSDSDLLNMTTTEKLNLLEENAFKDYNTNINYAEEEKVNALKLAEQARANAKAEAEALYRQNASNYGLQGERMLEQGLAGGGYSEFLEGKNMETRALNYGAANSNYISNAQNAQTLYSQALREAEQQYMGAQDDILNARLEYADELQAEHKAMYENILAQVNSGLYDAETAKTMMGVYGGFTDAEWSAVQAASNSYEQREGKALVQQIYADLVERLGAGLTREIYADHLRAQGIDDATINRIVNTAFDESGHLIDANRAAERLNTVLNMVDAVRAGTYVLDEAKKLLAGQLGITVDQLTESDLDMLKAAESAYKRGETESQADKLLSAISTMGAEVTMQSVYDYLTIALKYTEEQAKRVINDLFDGNGKIKLVADRYNKDYNGSGTAKDEFLAGVGNNSTPTPDTPTTDTPTTDTPTTDTPTTDKPSSGTDANSGAGTAVFDNIFGNISSALGLAGGATAAVGGAGILGGIGAGGAAAAAGAGIGGTLLIGGLGVAAAAALGFIVYKLVSDNNFKEQLLEKPEEDKTIKLPDGTEVTVNLTDKNAAATYQYIYGIITGDEHLIGDPKRVDLFTGDDIKTADKDANGKADFDKEALEKIGELFSGIARSGAKLASGDGDYFTVRDLDGTEYAVRSGGVVNLGDKVNALISSGELKAGEVFGYNRELYMVRNNQTIKIEPRILFGNGDFAPLWKEIYGNAIMALKDEHESATVTDSGDYKGIFYDDGGNKYVLSYGNEEYSSPRVTEVLYNDENRSFDTFKVQLKHGELEYNVEDVTDEDVLSAFSERHNEGNLKLGYVYNYDGKYYVATETNSSGQPLVYRIPTKGNISDALVLEKKAEPDIETGTDTGEGDKTDVNTDTSMYRGAATATRRGGSNYVAVNVDGYDYDMQIKGQTFDASVLNAAEGADPGEVFVYDDTLYYKDDGDGLIYELQSRHIAGDPKAAQYPRTVIEAVKANSAERDTYTNTAFKTGGTYDGDGGNLEKGAWVSVNKDGKTYKFEIDAVQGATTEAAKAAKQEGIADGEVFNHREDMYIYKDGKAYKLSAVWGFQNWHYDAFVEASTGQKTWPSEGFNYSDFIKEENQGNGNASTGNAGGTQNGTQNGTQGNSGGGNVGGAENTATGDPVKRGENQSDEEYKALVTDYINNTYKNSDEYEETIYSESELQEKGYSTDFINALEKTNDGRYVWYKLKSNTKNQAYIESQGGKITGGGEWGGRTENGTTLIGGKEYRLKGAENTGLEGIYSDVGNVFVEKGDKTYFLASNGKGKPVTVYEVIKDSVSQGVGTIQEYGYWNKNNIDVEVDGKEYRVEIGGKLDASEGAQIIEAANDAGIQDGEVFAYGENMYVRIGGEYHKIDQQDWFFYDHDEKLYKALKESQGKERGEVGEAVQNANDKVYATDNMKPNSNTSIQVKGVSYNIRIGTKITSGSAPFDAAKNVGDKEFYAYGDKLYVKNGDGVYMVTGDDAEALKNVVTNGYGNKEAVKGYSGTVKASQLPLSQGQYTAYFARTSIDFKKGSEINDTKNNGGIIDFANNLENQSVFVYGENAYYKENGKVYLANLTRGDVNKLKEYLKNESEKPDITKGVATEVYADESVTRGDDGNWGVKTPWGEIGTSTYEESIEIKDGGDVYLDHNDKSSKIGKVVRVFGPESDEVKATKKIAVAPNEIITVGDYVYVYVVKDAKPYLMQISPVDNVNDVLKRYQNNARSTSYTGQLSDVMPAAKSGGEREYGYSDYLI